MAARGDEFTRLLTEMRDSKGSVYTQGLVGACGRLGGTALERTREAFAIRLSRMTPATLSSMLADSVPEVRLAAAKAVGLKSAIPLANDLVALIADSNRAVASAAVASLRKLTDRDFGPSDDAGPDERAEAIRAWKRWLAERK